MVTNQFLKAFKNSSLSVLLHAFANLNQHARERLSYNQSSFLLVTIFSSSAAPLITLHGPPRSPPPVVYSSWSAAFFTSYKFFFVFRGLYGTRKILNPFFHSLLTITLLFITVFFVYLYPVRVHPGTIFPVC